MTEDQPEPSSSRWHRDVWFDAVWDSDGPKPNERLLAYTFARYAGRKRVTWCPWNELQKRSGIKSRDAIHRAIRGLVEGGWLVEVQRARQYYSARYELTIPEAQESVKRTSEGSVSRTSEAARGPLKSSRRPLKSSRGPLNGPEASTTSYEQKLGTGATLPPPPLRGNDDPSGRRSTDQGDLRLERGTDQTDLDTQPTTAHVRNENVVPIFSRKKAAQ